MTTNEEITVRPGDRLHPLLALISDTHIDDLPNYRLQQLEEMVRGWRITRADGSPLTGERI